jgi:hypothetical protein
MGLWFCGLEGRFVRIAFVVFENLSDADRRSIRRLTVNRLCSLCLTSPSMGRTTFDEPADVRCELSLYSFLPHRTAGQLKTA